MNFWDSNFDHTVEQSARNVAVAKHRDVISEWFRSYEEDKPTSSNQGTENVPFQRWFKFKEAFSPKFVADTFNSRPYQVSRCVDPFGGSGTSAVTARMLGIRSVTCEVNPFLADLISAKLKRVNAGEFQQNVLNILDKLTMVAGDFALPDGYPPTLTEPGTNGRYIFDSDTFGTIRGLLRSASNLPDAELRLVKVIVGSVLIENSNVRISGKGRRYRTNWQERVGSGHQFLESFRNAFDMVVDDLTKFRSIPKGDHRVMLGDARSMLSRVRSADIAIFSPPYPNSFDYTDVYNVELWMLDYLTSSQENFLLRQSTLRSHVQTKWQNVNSIDLCSNELRFALEALKDNEKGLWDKNIPNMISAYFIDLYKIFVELRRILPHKHDAVVAIGDSRYAGVLIDISKILPQIVAPLGFEVESKSAIRTMRCSPQHGGKFDLLEHCLVFRKK